MGGELTESQEDYLEAIYETAAREQGARSSEIADAMGVKRPSVTSALKTLADKGLVNYTPYDRVSLTHAGETVARNVVARHGIIRQFLIGVLGVAAADAQTEACRLEHAFTPAVFARFVQFLSVLERCPERLVRWDPSRGFACGKGACKDCAPRPEERGPEKAGPQRHLKDLDVGEIAEIVGYRGKGSDYRQKLLAMGLTRGVRVTVAKVTPLGDPVEIEIRGFRLTVRKDEADALIVRRLQGGGDANGARRGRRGVHGGPRQRSSA